MRKVKLFLIVTTLVGILIFLAAYNHQSSNRDGLIKIQKDSLTQSSSHIPREWNQLLTRIKNIIEIEAKGKYGEVRNFDEAIKNSVFTDITGDSIPEMMIMSPTPPAGGDCYYIIRINNRNPEFVNLAAEKTYPIDGCDVGAGVNSSSFYFDTEHRLVVREQAYLGGNEPKCTAEIFKWDNNKQALVLDSDKVLQDSTAKSYCDGFKQMFQ